MEKSDKRRQRNEEKIGYLFAHIQSTGISGDGKSNQCFTNLKHS